MKHFRYRYLHVSQCVPVYPWGHEHKALSCSSILVILQVPEFWQGDGLHKSAGATNWRDNQTWEITITLRLLKLKKKLRQETFIAEKL